MLALSIETARLKRCSAPSGATPILDLDEILFTMAAQLLIKINVGPSLAERNGQL
jgi:hypothetical protein